ncbi:MAG: hypothetical protein PWQ82_860 [Thermosediminibacterales bacterium]|nr:hypothetical protein [Thermosediminibacterales bacterium]
MKIKVLGNMGAFPHNNLPCSGYLVENDEDKILVDCGSGVLLKLKEHCSINKLSGIIISHLHWDHFSDLMPMRYEIDYLQTQGIIKEPIPLYCPARPKENFDLLQYKNTLRIETISSNKKIKFGSTVVEFFEVKHPIECYGMKFMGNKKKICYSADTEYFPEIINEVSGADVFLCEASVLQEDEKTAKGHLSGPQAAKIAIEAGISRLILTHFWPYYDSETILNEAKSASSGVEIHRSEVDEDIIV